MSIYCTTVDFSDDDHDHTCGMWVPCKGHRWSECTARTWYVTGAGNRPTRTHYRLDLAKRCTCRCGPIAYQASHVMPTDDDPREGSFDLGEIPGYVRRAGEWDAEDLPPYPWLRVSVNDETVLLDLDQVKEVSTYLAEWVKRTEGKPA